jgi:AraC-like DNA-binding protein
MLSFNLQNTFLIKRDTALEHYEDKTKRSYFEILFIEEGKGKHYINEFIVSYQEGDIFLIAPEDTHRFEIIERTRFCHFRFTELLFSSKMNLPDRSYWLHRIEHIIHNPNLLPGDIIKERKDRYLIWHIHDVILNEYESKKTFYKHNISNMVSTILSIIARNISSDFELNAKRLESDKHATIDQIIAYIHHNIYDSDLIKVHAIAEKFNMTRSGLSSYFKRKSGESLHHYVLMYKLHLTKYRLKNTDFTVSEIALQLGFTDESHLTRIFKKYNAMTPKQFKVRELETNNNPLYPET